MGKVEGFLEVGSNGNGEIVINHPDLKPDENGVGHIVFSVTQARNLARMLESKARDAENEIARLREEERIRNVPPVDRTNRCMTSGNPESPDHRKLLPNGQQKDYVILCPQERAKGFVRPVRRTYIHKPCRTTTTCSQSIAETYARDPYFYSGTFCCHCAKHFPLDQFVWEDGEQVGS